MSSNKTQLVTGSILPKEEYVEQEYLFKTLRERKASTATQELLRSIRYEILATTRLPTAMEFMENSLKHTGSMAEAMTCMAHYFAPFQTFIMEEAERESGRFDYQIALEILEKEAHCRALGMPPQAMFLYQFECISRNRLNYERGLSAVARDPVYDGNWREWLYILRRQLGLADFAEMIYVRSEYYPMIRKQPAEKPLLFGEKEGRIALANRRKDPVYLFSAFQRHLQYPTVPRHTVQDSEESLIFRLRQTVDKLETRMKFLEDELHGGVDITQYYIKESEK